MTTREIRLALCVLMVSGCRTPGAPSGGQASPSSIASASPTAPLVSASPTASGAPLLGSAPTGTRDERERALLGFLDSGRAAQVPVVATEPGVELDRSLRQSLLGHFVEASAPAARGKAEMGAATATGGEIANVNRVIAGMRAGFRSCYQRALVDFPNYAGKLQLKLTVDTQGAVTTAKVTSPQHNQIVFACVERRANAAQFEPPAGGKPATVTLSVTLMKE